MLFVITPQVANAAPATSSTCSAGIGVGSNSASRAGNGCVLIEYGTLFETFNYTGAAQQWTVPTGVTSVTFHAVGAGGGAGNAEGGGGGYATGSYSVTAGNTFEIIVGQGGIRHSTAFVVGFGSDSR
jgi:hypothetical protein